MKRGNRERNKDQRGGRGNRRWGEGEGEGERERKRKIIHLLVHFLDSCNSP